MPLALVILLGIVLFFITRWQSGNDNSTTSKKPGQETVNRDYGFDRRISYLEYSDHANCRMKCRHITQSEVQEIMKVGKINYKKSDLKNVRCPRYAIEGITSDQQRVRIVFAQCNEKTVVVTVIDLEKEWTCDCPGDEGPGNSNNKNTN
jgi:hypothetical protein